MQKTDKSYIRKHFQAVRKNILSERKEEYSQKITEQLQKIICIKYREDIQKTLHICLFAGTKNEPNILALLDIFSQEVKEGKIKFYFPKCNTLQKTMDFYEIQNISDLIFDEKQKLKILEPDIESSSVKIFDKKNENKNLDIFIIPAVSIDTNNNRIGMGGGFYDIYFEKYFLHHSRKETEIICTIFEAQRSKKCFLVEKFDIPVNRVITEKTKKRKEEKNKEYLM